MSRLRSSALANAVLVWLLVFGVATGHAQSLAAGLTAFHEGRYDDAIKTLSAAARDEPGAPVPVRALARALMEVGRYDEAEDAIQRFTRANPSSVELFNTLGEVLAQSGQQADARRAFAQAIDGNASDRLRARLNQAVLLYEAGSHEEALRAFDTFIDVYNQDNQLSSEVLTAVGTAVRYLGVNDWQLFKDALRAYDEAIARDPTNLEPRVLVGELFLEKYESQQARAAFEEVLQRNARHPRALLGVAKTDRFDGAASAVERVRESLEVNPHFVSARVFLASLLAELEDYAGALKEVDQALKTNPSSLEAMATSAAIRYLMDDKRGFETAVDRALSINPRFAELYNTLADVSAKSRRYADAVRFATRAVELDPKSWRAYVLLGMNQLRTGAVSAGRANLDTSFTGDPYNAWTKNTLDLLDTLVQYPRTTTERFEFHIDAKESALLSLYLGPLAEEAFETLAVKYAYRPETPIRVEVFPDHADFSVRTVGLVGLGALGVSFGPVMAMDSPSAREVGDFNWGTTFWHELAHTFHLGMTDGRVPRWFTEGLAVFEERQARPGWGADVIPAFLNAFREGRLVPLDDMNRGFMRPAFPEQIGFSYYQASLICELIARDHGERALVDMLGGFRAGESSAEVFRRVLGLDVDALQRRFDGYVEERFGGQLAALKDLDHSALVDVAAALTRAAADSSDFVAQLGAGKHHFDAGRMDDAQRYLERAKTLFPEYAGDDSPYWFLAQIHRATGALRKAAAELETLVGFNEQHYQAHVQLADLRRSLGDSAGAAAALEALMFIYPYETAVHQQLAELYAGVGQQGGAIRERQAILALDPVDRADALYELALAYFQAEDLGSARKTVLQSLEMAPNYEKAQDLLLEIYSKRSGGS